MSKPQLSFRVPKNLRDDIEAIREEQGIDDRSEAARQVLRRGLDAYDGATAPGETLGRHSTSVAGVGTVAAAIAVVLGQSWASALVVPFGLTTFVFALLWASVRVLDGRELL